MRQLPGPDGERSRLLLPAGRHEEPASRREVDMMEDAEIRDLVVRLSRPHPSGGKVIERAAILAAGAGSADVLDWIVSRAGEGEAASTRRAGGLHGGRLAGAGRADGPPVRYVLPAGALD